MSDDEVAERVRIATRVFDEFPHQVAVLDDEGVIRATNRAWETFGIENDVGVEADMVGENYLAVCRAGEDEDSATAAEGISAVIDGRRDEFSFEYPCHEPDQRRWFTMRATPFEFEGETLVLIVHTDITDRHRAETNVSERNETLEMVTGILSHDLRNPLSVATARTELLRERSDGSDNDDLAAIERSLERIRDIIDDALLIARQTEPESLEALDLRACAERAWEQVATGDATLVVEADATVEADETLLAQLLENLFRNAVEHGGGDVTVTVSSREGGFVVADDGPGIPESERDAVFESGYTTNQDGGGTGLGLAIVSRIADLHGWSIRATDGPDGGAAFVVSGVAVEQ
ncbi:sensor histidine kinase [Haloarcula nitratireducens]|uniref:histidine kinase n=1 Tax=Haloarcula nitratireducens TaxID=2487749 RepID=A0AAW4PC58_9EURY|nr:PAS domain-containing sensor histidine kinase [Halomicroarcula nitratireducens]MBX0295470.1 PAS domain-containing sensor histidine kinase [Halomicroarcula nitratireducens]